MTERPRVGLGVIIENEQGQILIGKRAGSHAAKYSIPGGGLEIGETFEEGAIREVQEEHSIRIHNPKVIAVTNNLETYWEEGIHFISVILVAEAFDGIPTIKEPEKCESIEWVDPETLPQPHFDASRLAIECYIKGEVYAGITKSF